jgi:DNA replication and repair protein RecF
MFLSALKIENFKNYEKAELSFSENINCMAGPNGSGKTNILDAIYYLCTGKSYFNPADLQLIFNNSEYFSIKGEFLIDKELENILCVLIKGRRKVIKRNDEAYAKLVDHYGAYPVVMVAPADLDLISGGSEERRKWLDSTISWIDHGYLQNLLKYDKILQQRNSVIRNAESSGNEDYEKLLKVYDEMMIPLANEIHSRRGDFIEEFLPYFSEYHKLICGENESVSLKYQSEMLHGQLEVLLANSRKKDLALLRTTSGPHRDDLEFMIGENALKRFGSQGQQKTFLLALKLAQHQYLKSKKGKTPILLLDDVSERLDEQRLSVLFRLIQQKDKFGQVFVTDTSEARLQSFLGNTAGTKVFRVENGKITTAADE